MKSKLTLEEHNVHLKTAYQKLNAEGKVVLDQLVEQLSEVHQGVQKNVRRPKMANNNASNCGECELFQGSSQKCGGGSNTSSINNIAKGCNSFKGPASLFDTIKCGGCRLFEGAHTKCGAGKNTNSINGNAKGCSSYAKIPG